MKEVLAIIRMNKINATKQALVEAGFPAFTGAKVMGRGSKPVDFEVVQAVNESQNPAPEVLASLQTPGRLIAKRMISLVLPDDRVKPVVDIIIKTNQTGRQGDGKIFVLPIDDAARVRTRVTGEEAVSEMAG